MRRKRMSTDAGSSWSPDYVTCLEDGKKLKMLKGHLRALRTDDDLDDFDIDCALMAFEEAKK